MKVRSTITAAAMFHVEHSGPIGPDSYPTHTAGSEQLDAMRGDWVGAYDQQPVTGAVTALYGPVFPTRPYDVTLTGIAPNGADVPTLRLRTLPGERVSDLTAIDKAASAWLRARCEEDLSVVDVRREVTAPNGVESMWQYPLVKADRVAYLGEQRVKVRSHRYQVDHATGSLITWAIGRGYRFVGHRVERDIPETARARFVAKRTATRAETRKTPFQQSKRTMYRNLTADVLTRADTLENVLRTSATGATITLAPGLTVTVHAATVDHQGKSWPIREWSRRAALAGHAID